MRLKAIIVLNGVNEGKTKFSKVTKNENFEFYEKVGWWTWQVNPNNVLGVVASTLGSPGIRDDKYYEFIGKLKDLSNEYWDFDNLYVDEMVEKFGDSLKTELLIVHGANRDMANRLKNDYGAVMIGITSSKSDMEFVSEYDKVLVWDTDNFVIDVVEFLDNLTKGE